MKLGFAKIWITFRGDGEFADFFFGGGSLSDISRLLLGNFGMEDCCERTTSTGTASSQVLYTIRPIVKYPGASPVNSSYIHFSGCH